MELYTLRTWCLTGSVSMTLFLSIVFSPQQTDFVKLNLIYISAHGFIQTDNCLQVDLTQ